MKKRLVKENVGRQLVGAGAYASRSSVVKKIMDKYPNPQSMAKQLSKLASATQNTPQLSTKYQQLASACANLSNEQYPAFVKKITGFSKLWSTTAKVAGAAVAAAGAAYLTKLAINAYNDPTTFLNSDDIDAFNKSKDTLTGNPEDTLKQMSINARQKMSFGDKSKMFGSAMLKGAQNDWNTLSNKASDLYKRNIVDRIDRWRGQQLAKAADENAPIMKDVKATQDAIKSKMLNNDLLKANDLMKKHGIKVKPKEQIALNNNPVLDDGVDVYIPDDKDPLDPDILLAQLNK